MKIQSIIRRAKGTTVKLGDQVYFFSSENDHTCDVTDEAHIDRFLSIKEGFRQVATDTQKPPAKVKQTATEPVPPAPVSAPVAPEGGEPVALVGSSVHPSEFDINGRTYSLGDVVAKAHDATGMSVEDWNALSDDERHDLIDAELDKLAADVDGDGDVDRDDLIAAYVAKFGKKPHHATKAETIAAKLAEAGKQEG